MKRREFIKKSSMALGSIPFVAGFLKDINTAYLSVNEGSSPILIAVFLRGGADGLNIVAPYGDPYYSGLRPTIGINSPGTQGGALDLDGFFGLHPKLPGFKSYFDQGKMAIVHACGSPNETRSHFDAMDLMESGSGLDILDDGWLNRYLQTSSSSQDIFQAVSIGTAVVRSLSGIVPSIAIPNLDMFQMFDSDRMKTYLSAIRELNAERADFIGITAHSVFEALEIGQNNLDPQTYIPENGAEYPTSDFSSQLKILAHMIKADLGVRVATVDLGGWDTHTNQGDGESGSLATALETLDPGMGAFVTDLGNHLERLIILIMTEFGRTAKQNGSGGTDHGHGTAMFAIGEKINGGRVYGQWPGLAQKDLYEGRDLAVTTDYRQLFGEVLENHMGCTDIPTVFPGYDYDKSLPLGLF
jgi:uncharacterized protein (DUF1501 family)